MMMAHSSGDKAVSIELLDHGMIVTYQVPVKRMQNVRRSSDPLSVMLEAMLPRIMESFTDSEDEDWSEEKRAKKEMMQTAMEKAKELINPKPKESWVWSDVRVVVADVKDLPQVIELAKQGMQTAKKLREEGEYINASHGTLMSPFVGSYMNTATVGEGSLGEVFGAEIPLPPHKPIKPSDLE